MTASRHWTRCTSLLFPLLGLMATVSGRGEIAAFTIGKIEYVAVVPGLDYAHVRETNQPLSIHIARLERNQKELQIVSTLAQDRIQGLAPLSRQIAALPADIGTPLAAINGDFFEIKPGAYQGDPDGLQVVHGEVVSAPNDKAFWIDPQGEPHIGTVYSRFEVHWPNQSRGRFDLNQAPRSDRATLFTPAFGAATRTTNVTELVLEPLSNKPLPVLRIAETNQLRVREIRAEGNSLLTSNCWVLALTDSAKTNLEGLLPGDTLTFTTATSANIRNPRVAIGGGPVLLRQGIAQPWPARKSLADYLQPRHPRTAIGFNDHHLFLVAVDGRQRELSVGVSFVELASLLQQIGCTDALNLDGGGSTTFWLNGKVMNSPSDRRERSIANGLVIVRQPR